MGFFKKERNIEYEIADIERKIKGQKVNHILHFLLSIVTAGIWIIVWILITISASIERSRLEGLLKKAYNDRDKEKKQNIQKDDSGTNTSTTIADQLTKLSELLEKGHITEEEFAVQKGKILNN